jgi:hypothetical protein
LKAARLFSPCTRASLAKKSLPCRIFHLVDEEDDAYRMETTPGELRSRHDALIDAVQRPGNRLEVELRSNRSAYRSTTRRGSMNWTERVGRIYCVLEPSPGHGNMPLRAQDGYGLGLVGYLLLRTGGCNRPSGKEPATRRSMVHEWSPGPRVVGVWHVMSGATRGRHTIELVPTSRASLGSTRRSVPSAPKSSLPNCTSKPPTHHNFSNRNFAPPRPFLRTPFSVTLLRFLLPRSPLPVRRMAHTDIEPARWSFFCPPPASS